VTHGQRLDHLEREIDRLNQGRLAGHVTEGEWLERAAQLFCRLRLLEPAGRPRRR
jgi:hypothetical protein